MSASGFWPPEPPWDTFLWSWVTVCGVVGQARESAAGCVGLAGVPTGSHSRAPPMAGTVTLHCSGPRWPAGSPARHGNSGPRLTERPPPPLSSLLRHREARPGVGGGDAGPHRRGGQAPPSLRPLGRDPPATRPSASRFGTMEKSWGWDKKTWLRILVLVNFVTSLGAKWSSVSMSDPLVPVKEGGRVDGDGQMDKW